MGQKKRWVALAVLGLLLVGLVAAVTFDNVRRVAELAAEQGEILLRDELRPIRGETRVVVIALDGVGDEWLREALATDRMPRTAELLGEVQDHDLFAQAYAAPEALTIIPSITMAAWSSAMTGLPPAQTGVPGNEWYERSERKLYAPAALSIDAYDHTLRIFTDDFLNDVVQGETLFERVQLRSHVSHLMIHRGADLLNIPGPEDLIPTFGRVSAGVLEDEPITREVFASLDTKSVANALQSMEEHGIPDLQLFYLAGIDLYTHLTESPFEDQLDFLEDVIDPLIGDVIDSYAEAGVLEQTFFVIVSDHGHTPVLDDERHVLGKREDNDPRELMRQNGFRPRPLELEVDDTQADYQAVMAHEGPIAFVYVADRSTCVTEGERCDWEQPPRLEEDVLALARAFDRANRTGEGLPGLQGTLDLILVREPQALDQNALPFQVFDGEQMIPLAQYLEQNPRPDLPRFEERLEWLTVGPYGHRAGDIMLFTNYGANRPIEERFYFAPTYNSLHGGAEWQDSHIPLIVAHPQRSGNELRDLILPVIGDQPSILDLPAVVEVLLGE